MPNVASVAAHLLKPDSAGRLLSVGAILTFFYDYAPAAKLRRVFCAPTNMTTGSSNGAR